MDSQSETSRTLTIFILGDKAHRPGYLTLFYHCRPFLNSVCLFLHSPRDPLILAHPCFISLRFLKNSTGTAASLCLRAACQAWEVMALKRTAQLIDLSHQNGLYQGAQGVKWMFASYKSHALTPKRRSFAKTSFWSSLRTSVESARSGCGTSALNVCDTDRTATPEQSQLARCAASDLQRGQLQSLLQPAPAGSGGKTEPHQLFPVKSSLELAGVNKHQVCTLFRKDLNKGLYFLGSSDKQKTIPNFCILTTEHNFL